MDRIAKIWSMDNIGATPRKASSGELFDLNESAILSHAPERTGVYALFRPDPITNHKEAVLIGTGVLRSELLVALGKRLAPSATHFGFQICNLGREAEELSAIWEQKLPKAYGKRWKPLGHDLGVGGQSRVQLVKDIRGVRPGQYALKILKSKNNDQARTRFKTEVEATQRIDHPSVLRIHDFDVDSKRPYYVAEYCEGKSLLDRGADEFRGNLRHALEVLLPIADALVAVHRAGVIHRDIKPANILFRKDETPVIGDFGICYLEDGEPATFSDEAVGSRHYLAPEMEAGNRALGDPTDKTDVYALGKLLFWMVSGGKKFDRENHRGTSLIEMHGKQSFEHVHELLDRMVAYEPSRRLGISELDAEFAKVLALVEGNYAPLKPSLGILCRFCGVGKYEEWSSFDSTDPKRAMPLQPISKLGLQNYQGANFRILRCSHCGHVEIFQFEAIKARNWWDA